MKVRNKILNEIKNSNVEGERCPLTVVKNDYTFIPTFSNRKQIQNVQNLQQTAIFSNLFRLKKDAAKLMLLQLWVFIIRYIIPILGLIILTNIEKKGLTDVYFYANSLAIVIALFLILRVDKIKNFSLKITILIFVTFSFSTFLNFSVGIFSIDRFMYHLSYAIAFWFGLFFIVKDIFINTTFTKIWYQNKHFYLAQKNPTTSKLKILLAIFFISSAILSSGVSAYMGYLVTTKKIEVLHKIAK